MSVKMTRLVWQYRCSSTTEKIVLLALADFADDTGHNARPSKQTLAAICHLDVRTVHRQVASLLESGVIGHVAQRAGLPTHYCLNIPMLTGHSAAQTPGAVPPWQDATPGTVPYPPLALDTEPLAQCHPIHQEPPINNHHIEKEADASAAGDSRMVLADAKKPKAKKVQPTLEQVVGDWPVLHVLDGDFTVPIPYADHELLRENMIEWLRWRLEDRKKGLPTVFAMKRDNTAWWNRYAIDAVVHSVQRSASGRWIGIKEEVAREFKPDRTRHPSNILGGVQQSVQSMKDMMQQRQQMIRAAAVQSTTPALPATGDTNG